MTYEVHEFNRLSELSGYQPEELKTIMKDRDMTILEGYMGTLFVTQETVINILNLSERKSV